VNVTKNGQQILVETNHPFCLQCGVAVGAGQVTWKLPDGTTLQEAKNDSNLNVKVINGILKFDEPSVYILDGDNYVELSCHGYSSKTSFTGIQVISSSKHSNCL